MVNRETLQGMIQLSTSSMFANGVKPNGLAGTVLPEGAEVVDFAALLGAAGLAAEAPQAGPVNLTAAITTTSIALPDGKTGKPAGKTLPVEEAPIAVSPTTGDIETHEAPDEAISDQADVPIAAAIPVLPLIVPPLPGTGNSAELRAAVPDSVSSQPLVVPTTTRPLTSVQHVMVAAARQSSQRGQTETAVSTSAPPRPAAPTVATAAIPGAVLGVKLDPVVTVTVQPQAPAKPQAPVNSAVPTPITAIKAPVVTTNAQPRTMAGDTVAAQAVKDQPIAGATGMAQPRTVAGETAGVQPVKTQAIVETTETQPAIRNITTSTHTAEVEAPAVSAPATADVQSKAIPGTSAPVQVKATPLPPVIAPESSTTTESDTRSGENRETPVRVETQVASSRTAAASTRTSVEPAATPGQSVRPEITSVNTPVPAPGERVTPSATQTAPSPTTRETPSVARNEKQEPQAQAAADVVAEPLADGTAEGDRTAQAARPGAQFSPLVASQPEAPAPRLGTAPVAAPTPTAGSEQPHDFATLVDRLSEAREAASPQVVRTALHHADFGRVSLQFRHDDGNLSVTMANADPAFTSAVHNAVAASASGSAAGNGDQPRQEGQQGLQQQSATQQQAATSGNGQGQAQQQAAQARADQGERNSHRAHGSPAHQQQERGASSARSEAGTRRSGIYA